MERRGIWHVLYDRWCCKSFAPRLRNGTGSIRRALTGSVFGSVLVCTEKYVGGEKFVQVDRAKILLSYPSGSQD
jgi:hypothetical protein